MKKPLLDELLSSIDSETETKQDPCGWATLAWVVPQPVKDKYDKIQNASNRRSGKLLKKLLLSAIDSIYDEHFEGTKAS